MVKWLYLAIGLGLPLLKMNINKGIIRIDFFNKQNLINILCLGFLFLNIIVLGIHAKYCKYNLDIKVAIIRFAFYFVFLIFICLFTFIKI